MLTATAFDSDMSASKLKTLVPPATVTGTRQEVTSIHSVRSVQYVTCLESQDG